MKTINTISSQFGDWHAFLKALNWADDRTHYENTRMTFLEAVRRRVPCSKAFYEVANKIYQAGRTVDWGKLHDIWHTARKMVMADGNGRGVNTPSPVQQAVNGSGAKHVVVAHAPVPTNGHPHQPKPHQVKQRGGASLVSYYL
jgi:hypothetical protein